MIVVVVEVIAVDIDNGDNEFEEIFAINAILFFSCYCYCS